jgi:hypothetical protein
MVFQMLTEHFLAQRRDQTLGQYHEAILHVAGVVSEPQLVSAEASTCRTQSVTPERMEWLILWPENVCILAAACHRPYGSLI